MFCSLGSVNEFVLAREENVIPIGPVTGNSVYKLDWHISETQLSTGEVKPLMRPLLDVYLRALIGMQHDAQALGAHLVLQVRLEETRTYRRLSTPKNRLTVKATGTAVSLNTEKPPEMPTLCALSGQDFFALRRAGYTPAGVVLGQSVFYEVSQGRSLFSTVPRDVGIWEYERINCSIERPEFTHAVAKARSLALRRLEAEARYLGADGVLGMTVQFRPSWVRRGLIVEFRALGTAVVAQNDSSSDPINLTLPCQ